METGGSSALELVLLVVATPAILVLAAYGLVVLWRKNTRATVNQIGEQIQGFDNRINQVATFLRSYVKIDKEPYSTQLDELQTEASGLHTRVQSFLGTCQAFEEEIRQPGDNFLLDKINAPVHWFRRWRRSTGLLSESKAIASQLTTAEEHMQSIYELPLDLARQCLQADKDAAELFKATQALQLKGARGAALNTIVTQIPHLERGLDEIPKNFFETDREALLAANNLLPTIRAFEVLNRIRPAIDRYLPQVHEWNATYDKAAGEYNELKVAGASLRQAMDKPPEGLMIAAIQERLDQIAQLAAELNLRLVQPEVEDLKPLSREISQLKRVIQDTEHQFSRASQQVTALTQSLGELQANLDKLTAQMAEHEHNNVFPLAWDESSGLLSDLRKRLQSIGPALQPRPPEQISKHLNELDQIRAGLKTHTGAFPKIAEQYRALVALLESAEFQDGAARLRKAREMLNQAGVYDTRNWPKQDSIQTLPVELEDLIKFHEELVPADHSALLRESELSVRLRDTRKLADQHKQLRPRIESVEKRLAKVHALEKESKEKLTGSFAALERVALLAENNDLLFETANELIDRLSEEIRQLGNELNARAQGEIDKKAQKINAQTEKVNRELNNWLARLNTAIVELGSQMNGLVSQLDAIATLDDATVADTRDLLARDEYVSAIYGNRGGARADGAHGQTGGLRGMAAKVAERGAMLQRPSMQSDLDITAEIKRKNDLWLTLNAVSQALNERIDSLLQAQEETVKARNAAQEELAEVTRRVPERRAWPPSNQVPLTETQMLQTIDAKRDALKKQPKRVDAVILELGHLAHQYQNAAEHAHQVLDRAAQDEERVQDLEEQISEIKQRWQAHAQANPGNLVMREGVQQLMSQTDSKVAYIKQQYMRGALSYEQVIRSLQLLYDELYSSRVSIDDKNDIGLNETRAPDTKRPVNQR